MTTNLKIWIKSQKPFIIRSKNFGEIRLHSFLRLSDFETLLNFLSDNTLTPREFTIKVLNEVAFTAFNENISDWDDKTLLMIARKWSKRVLFQEINEKRITDFEDFQTVVSEYISKTNEIMIKAIKGIQISLANQLKSSLPYKYEEKSVIG